MSGNWDGLWMLPLRPSSIFASFFCFRRESWFIPWINQFSEVFPQTFPLGRWSSSKKLFSLLFTQIYLLPNAFMGSDFDFTRMDRLEIQTQPRHVRQEEIRPRLLISDQLFLRHTHVSSRQYFRPRSKFSQNTFLAANDGDAGQVFGANFSLFDFDSLDFFFLTLTGWASDTSTTPTASSSPSLSPVSL